MPLLRSPVKPPSADREIPLPAESGAVDTLLQILGTSPSAAARRAAARELDGLPDAARALAAHLGHEGAPEVREAIVTTLIEIASDAAVRGLADYFGSEDAETRNAVVEALRQIGGLSAPIMKERLASSDPDERIFAINVMEGLDHADVAASLRDVLAKDPDMNVGLAAVEALAQIGRAEDAAALRAFAARFPDEPFVGFAVRLACERVAGQLSS